MFVRANAMRQRSSSYTPWIVSEDLVRQYNIPSKLASIFINPKTAVVGKKRKPENVNQEKVKKMKTVEQPKESSVPSKTEGDVNSVAPVKKPRAKRDPNAPRKKPGPKPGFKRTPKLSSPVKGVGKVDDSKSVSPVKKTGTKRDPNTPRKKPGPKPGSKRTPKLLLTPKRQPPVKVESSDSDDDVSLAVLANKSPKIENGTSGQSKAEASPDKVLKPIQQNIVAPPGIVPLDRCKKRILEKDEKESSKPMKKMKQATLFDMKPPKKKTNASPRARLSPLKSPPKRVGACSVGSRTDNHLDQFSRQ